MDISDIVKPIGHRGAKAALEALPRMPRALLSRPDPQTREFMALYNALRDQGVSIGYTDGRDFRIRALNAAGKSGWSNVVRPFRVGEACVGAVGLGAQAGNNTIDTRSPFMSQPRHGVAARREGAFTWNSTDRSMQLRRRGDIAQMSPDFAWASRR